MRFQTLLSRLRAPRGAAGAGWSAPRRPRGAVTFEAPPATPKGMAAAIAAGRTVMRCDWPILDGTASADEYLHVHGWACCRAGLEEVSVIAQGRRFEPRTDVPRPDVERVLPGVEGSVSGFFLVLDTRHWAPGLHELTVRAIGQGGSAVAQTGVVLIGPDLPYRAWLRRSRRDGASEVEISPTPGGAAPALAVHVVETAGALDGLGASLVRQTHSNWHRAVGSLGDTLHAVAGGGEPAVLVEDRGALAPGALARLATAMGRDPAPDLVYADEDAVMADGERGDAFLKPGWSPELLLSTDYIGPLLAIGPRAASAAIAAESEPPWTIYEVMLRIVDAPLSVERVPETLFTFAAPRVPADDPQTRDAIEQLAARRGRRARVVPLGRPGTRDVQWELDEEPLVSVIIPSNSNDLLARCLRSQRERTAYPRLEVVVVDSSAAGLPCAGELLEGLAHRVVPYHGRFNFSRAVNIGAEHASGDHLVLLNDDTEVWSPDWIERMLEHLLTPGVGVVGCKLLYPSGKVQHAGVVFARGASGVGHINLGFSADAPGYRGMLQMARNWSAVTGACMMVSAELFAELDGFDESFESEFSDTDLCLRAIEGGRRVAWTPHAVLTHHERSSLPMEVNRRDLQRFGERWSSRYSGGDPFYHPAFLALSYELPRDGIPAADSLPPMEARPPSEGASPPAAGTEAEFEPSPRTVDELAKAISEGRTAMRCDYPPLNGKARAVGFLDIVGWAYSRAGIDDVSVYLDGLRYRAKHGFARKVLEDRFGDELAGAGFELTIELDPQQSGWLPLTVVARGTDGHAVGVRGEVECRPAPGLSAVPLGGDGADSVSEPFEAPAFGPVERFVREDAQGTPLEAEHEARYRWATEIVGDREVLDAGCGMGYGTAALAGAGAKRAVGVDISQGAILDARERFGGVGEFVAGDLHELPFEDDSFDVVVCFEAAVHVRYPERALDELRRVLRPEGVLLLSVPNAAVYPPGNPFHLHEYLPDEVEAALVRRFANVRLYRQQSHFASLVGNDATLAEPAPERDLSRVRTLAQARPGEELYTIAAASDTELPDMSTLTLLGGRLEERSWQDLPWSLQERVRIAEGKASASGADAHAARLETARTFEFIQQAEERRREAEATLKDIMTSLSWRVTRPLRLGRRALQRGRAVYRSFVPKRSRI